MVDGRIGRFQGALTCQTPENRQMSGTNILPKSDRPNPTGQIQQAKSDRPIRRPNLQDDNDAKTFDKFCQIRHSEEGERRAAVG